MSTPKISKFQRCEVETIQRDQIHGAPYNPRVINEGAKKRLKKMLRQHGLVTTLVWNKRTGNLVSGHQRLEALDALEGNQDYALHVAVVDVDAKEEKKLNVQMNNPSMQGEWDLDKLADMALEDDIGFADMGFSDADAEVLFGGDSRLADLFHDPEEVAETKDTLRDIKKDRAEATERLKEAQGAGFIVTAVAQDVEEKEALCRALGLPTYEEFVPAALILRKLAAAAGGPAK
ncbi:MAG: ParB N-terminal domain-containing protein [Desulfovibrio sp.]